MRLSPLYLTPLGRSVKSVASAGNFDPMHSCFFSVHSRGVPVFSVFLVLPSCVVICTGISCSPFEAIVHAQAGMTAAFGCSVELESRFLQALLPLAAARADSGQS